MVRTRFHPGGRNIALATTILFAVIGLGGADARAGSQSSGIVATQLPGSFETPVYVTSAPGYGKLVFVAEQGGVIRVLRNGVKLRRPFLDIRSRVTAGGEQGLLSVAFPPDYKRSKRFYVYFTNERCSGGGCDIEVAEYKRSRKRATRARAKSHRRVIKIRHRNASNHNGGTAMFGPDGKLWIATGDGGGSNDTFDNARKRGNLLGKLLRINPRPKRKGRAGHRIPKNNPFVGVAGRDEIWALGLRNPFRFSFDPERNAIAIGDVGQGQQEEINFFAIAETKGANFGWPEYEGTALANPGKPGLYGLSRLDPTYTYPNEHPSAVIGGVVLRDPRFEGVLDADPDDGIYLFGDAYQTFSHELQRFEPLLGPNAVTDYQTLPNAVIPSPAGFGVDRQQRVYVAARGDNRVYRLDPAVP